MSCTTQTQRWFSTLIEKKSDADTSVEWAINNFCNLRCKHCYMEADYLKEKKLYASLERKLEIVEMISKSCSNVVISGGEPLLDKHIVEVIGELSKRGCRVSLATNGTLLTLDMPARLRDAGLTHAQISIDAADESSHDEFRAVQGSWRKAMNAISRFQKIGIGVSISHTVHALNYARVHEIFELAERNAIGSIYLLKFLPCGEGEKNSNYVMSDEQEKALVLGCLARRSQAKVSFMTSAPEWNLLLGLTDTDSEGCTHGRIKFVNFTGELYSCPMVQTKVGSVLLGDMEPKKFTEAVVKFRDRSQLHGGDCASCPMLSKCGGCYASSGSLYADEYRRGECWVFRDVISNPLTYSSFPQFEPRLNKN